MSWTEAEKQYLCEHKGDGYKLVALKLNKTYDSVKIMASRLGIQNNPRKWAKEDELFLLDNYEKLTQKELAIKLNKTPMSVKKKLERVHILKNRLWTDEEIAKLKDRYGKVSTRKLAIRLNRTVEAVWNMAHQLGVYTREEEKVPLRMLIEAITGKPTNSRNYPRWLKMGFPYTTKVRNRRYVYVDMGKFWKWAENNKEKLDFSKFDEYSLGYEPLWVKTKRSQDRLTASKKRWALLRGQK